MRALSFNLAMRAAFGALLLAITSASAEPWYQHTRNLNASSGSLCTASLQPDLSLHFGEALLDVMLFQALGDRGGSIVETCQLVSNILDQVKARTNQTFVHLSPSQFEELNSVSTYFTLIGQSEDAVNSRPAVTGYLPALTDYTSDPGRTQRGFFRTDRLGQLTAAPSISELSNVTYSFLVDRGWSYVGLLWEAEPGSTRLSQQLQSQWRSDGSVCFPLLLSFTSRNVKEAARSLKDFVYVSRRLPRFTVAFVGSGAAFLRLWDLVSGSDSAFADTEKRYQLVLVGAAFSSFHRMSDTPRRRNLALGTVFIFPGILDPDVATDELRLLFSNITSDPASMGRFSELRDTHSRLNSLKQSTSSLCTWSDPNSLCYLLALRYDFHALSLAPLLADGVPSLSTIIDIQRLRQKSVTLSSLKTNLTILDSFIRAGFTSYSMERGLEHSTRGFWQPIAKIYQSQLSGTSYSLVKLGEMIVRQAGTIAQTYELDVSGRSRFYELTSGNPDIFPKETNSTASECPASCPECVSESEKQFIQFKEGDIYLGVLIPIFYRGNDRFNCKDGTFRTQNVGGYEFAMAFKFVVDLVDALSQGSPMPQGFNTSQVDQNFLRGVRDLLQRVHDGRTKKLRWGYVVLDTCYSPSCTVRRLGSLLDGTLASAPGFNFTKVVGFVGAHGSSQTAQASQLLKTYNLPLITYGSTAGSLSNFAEYPNVLRTGVSTSTVVQIMLNILKHLKVTYIVVVYVDTAFGTSLKDEMIQRAPENGLCIGQIILHNCKTGDDACKKVVLARLRESKARYVPFLADLSSFQAILNYDQVVTDIGNVTFLTTQSVGTSEAAYAGRNSVGIGALSMQFEAAESPAFLAYERYWAASMPTNPNRLSQWDRLHFESLNRCYLAKSFIRNSLYSQPCIGDVIASRVAVDSLESRTPLVIHATETLVLGTLTAVTYLCSTVTSEPVCSAFYKAGKSGQAKRANLIMYGTEVVGDPQRFSGTSAGTPWVYQKIFENRMGRLSVSVWQYRNESTGGYRYVQVGNYNGVTTSFSKSAESLSSQLRSGPAGGDGWCTKQAAEGACAGLTCLATGDTQPAASPSPTSASTASATLASQQLQGLWGLLGILGILLGVALVQLINCMSKKGACGAKEAEPEYDVPVSESAAGEAAAEPKPRSEVEMMEFAAQPAGGRYQIERGA
ncbi:hypothetical protein BOX15_Mlig025594g1 [Macrostomum lignano]|uniref:Receptor ligand binding region domain-containing protein n=1 Tax=Macrostomum lignano TaxID=282301 RepID=A0A267GFK7_9PLAT|nr:hypothetical protein BOX15_Mlig025594g1 [Macrostomum lignano]